MLLIFGNFEKAALSSPRSFLTQFINYENHIFRNIRNVLAPNGTIIVNTGECYVSGRSHRFSVAGIIIFTVLHMKKLRCMEVKNFSKFTQFVKLHPHAAAREPHFRARDSCVNYQRPSIIILGLRQRSQYEN